MPELPAADVRLPSRVQPISVVSVSQSPMEMRLDTHQTVNDARRNANIALQAKYINILKLLPCPFMAPLIPG